MSWEHWTIITLAAAIVLLWSATRRGGPTVPAYLLLQEEARLDWVLRRLDDDVTGNDVDLGDLEPLTSAFDHHGGGFDHRHYIDRQIAAEDPEDAHAGRLTPIITKRKA